MHNHGTEEGPGLSCPEIKMDDGVIRGACLIMDADTPFDRT